tara:strand:+ start:1425 stop:2231 length:807 start_codon:yes stop_codon:yes gene_type:complete
MSVRELARLANVAGDIRRQRINKQRRAEAEKLLSKRTDQAKKLSQKDMKYGWLLDALKFGANFIPVYGKAISAGISGIDAMAMAERTKAWENQFDKSVPAHLKGTPYEDFLKTQLGGLKEQLSGALESRRKANTLQEVLSAGLKVGSMKFGGSPAGSATTMPSGVQAIGPEGMPIPSAPFGESTKALSLFDRFLPKDRTLSLTLEEMFPAFKAGRDAVTTPIGNTSATLFDIGEYGKTFLDDLLTRDDPATSPAVPLAQIPSIRRRVR